jgi:hypothetical protein
MPATTPTYHRLSSTYSGGKAAQRPTRSNLKRLGISFLLLIPSLAFLGATLALSIFGLNFNETEKSYGCDPEGNVWIGLSNRPNLWSKDYGLAITLGFGRFSFTLAKSIDVLWDLIIGRGSQVVAGLAIYYIFRGPVVEMMDRSTVPYEKVLKMEYHSTGLSAFFTYCGDVHWKKRTRWQWFTALMIALSAAYVLIMPTLVSAMTGYQPLNIPLLKTDATTYVEFAELERCAFVVQDGARIGLHHGDCVYIDTDMYQGIDRCKLTVLTRYLSMLTSICSDITQYEDYYQPGVLANHDDIANISSTLYVPGHQPQDIPPPLLDIRRNDLENSNHIVYKNQTYSVRELANMGMCAPQATYRWGFSLILLFMFLSVTWVLSIPLYFIAVIHFWTTYQQPTATDKVFGTLRTPLAVAESIHYELHGLELDRTPEKEVRDMLRGSGSGMKVRRQLRESADLRLSGSTSQTSYRS